MNGDYLALAGRIRQELDDVGRVVRRSEAIWQVAERSPDDYLVDATALNLNDLPICSEKQETQINNGNYSICNPI